MIAHGLAIVAGDDAAVQVECALLYLHAASVFVVGVGDAALAGLAVGQGEGGISAYLDGVKIAIRRDAVAVEAEHRAVFRLPSAAQRHIFGQIPVARSGGQRHRGCPRLERDFLSLFHRAGAGIITAEEMLVSLGGIVILQSQNEVALDLLGLIFVTVGLYDIGISQLSYALGNDDIVGSGRLVCGGHTDIRAPSKAADGNGLSAGQVDVVLRAVYRVVGDLGRTGDFERDPRIAAYVYAAAVACSCIAADLAAVHVEGAVVLHTAVDVIAGNDSTEHIEYAGRIIYTHAAAIFPVSVGDLAAALAVGQNQRAAFYYDDVPSRHRTIRYDAEAVQTELDTLLDVDGLSQLDIAAQIIAALRQNIMGGGVIAADGGRGRRPLFIAHHQLLIIFVIPQLRGKLDLRYACMVADIGMRFAADAVLVLLGGGGGVRNKHQLGPVRAVVCDLVLIIITRDDIAVILIRIRTGSNSDGNSSGRPYTDFASQFTTDGDGSALTAVFLQVDIIRASIFFIACNGHIARNVEYSSTGAVRIDKHAATQIGGSIICNAAAIHGKNSVTTVIDSAAIFGCVVGDFTAIHGKAALADCTGAGFCIHAAAVFFDSIVSDSTDIITGNVATVHCKDSAILQIHAVP